MVHDLYHNDVFCTGETVTANVDMGEYLRARRLVPT